METNHILSELKIIEIGRDVSAPYCTKLLADLGADVIKIESSRTGDPLRSAGAFPNDAEDPTVGCLFRYLNTNKRSVAWDFNQEGDVKALLNLVSGADIVIENFGAGVLENFGLGLDNLTSANPRIALVRISDFGQDTPWANIAATDFTVQAASGWVWSHFAVHRDPVQVGGRIPDYVVGAHAACAALTAHKTSQELNEPVIVDVSKQLCLLSTLTQPALFFDILNQLGLGLPEDRVFPLPGVVRCKDGYVGLNCLTAQHFHDCCNLLGVPQYISKQMELNVPGPLVDSFYADIEPWLMKHGIEEIVELSQRMRVPAAPLGNGSNLLNFAQLNARSFFVREPNGEFMQPGLPWRMEILAAPFRTPAPKLGEHTAEVNKSPWPKPVTSQQVKASRKDQQDFLPFRGLRVIDLGTFWAGPYVSCYLGANGADVIKIESIQRPDALRYNMAYPQMGDDWYEHSGIFQGTNLNKRNLTLNLDSEEGKQILERLIVDADVLIENFSPRVLDNFGFGVKRLQKFNPRMIILRMPGFGLEGPWKNYVGWAMSIEQASGVAWMTGSPDEAPLQPGGFADPVIAMIATAGLLAMLHRRETTGEGQFIEVAQLEAVTCLTAEQVIVHDMTGRCQTRTGNRSDLMAPQGVYPCTGRDWVAISIRDDAEWGRFISLAGSSDWTTDQRFADLDGRLQHHDTLDMHIADYTRGMNSDELVQLLRDAGIPIAKILVAADMYTEPNILSQGFYQTLDHPRSGKRRYAGWPMRQVPGTNGSQRYGAATLGQHNIEILSGELGMSAGKIKDLEKKGILGTIPLGLG